MNETNARSEETLFPLSKGNVSHAFLHARTDSTSHVIFVLLLCELSAYCRRVLCVCVVQ